MSISSDRGPYTRTLTSLGSRIVAGALEPGCALDVAALEVEFQVSRTVIREALRVLAAKGLVDARPKRGTIVLPRTHWVMLDPDVLRWRFEDRENVGFLDELFELRLAVEPMVARLAAARRTDQDLAHLHLALGVMRAARDSVEHVDADLAFHRALLASAHNELFEHMATVIEVGLRVRDRMVHQAISHDATEEHRAVLDAVLRRRPQAAEIAMRALLRRSAADVEVARSIHPPATGPTVGSSG